MCKMANKGQWNLFRGNFTVLVSQSMVDLCLHVIWFHCQGLNNYSGEAQAPSTPIQTLLKTADFFFLYESAFPPHEISKPAHRNLNAVADPPPPPLPFTFRPNWGPNGRKKFFGDFPPLPPPPPLIEGSGWPGTPLSLKQSCQLSLIIRETPDIEPYLPVSRLQGHPTTVFCKISVRRSKNCLEFSIAWGRLKISRWPFHSCTIFVIYLINSLRFSKV